jgi:hypothetical protein
MIARKFCLYLQADMSLQLQPLYHTYLFLYLGVVNLRKVSFKPVI